MNAFRRRGGPPRRRKIAATAITGFVAALATLVFASPAYAATNLISNGNFATPAGPGAYHAGDTIGAWTVTAGQPDVIDLAAFNLTPAPPGSAPGTQAIELTGSDDGTISQSVPLTGGTAYLETFEYNENPSCGPQTRSIAFGVNNTNNPLTWDPATDSGWLSESIVVTAPVTGNYAILFKSTDPVVNACGIVFTDVSLTAVPVAGTPLTKPVIAAGGFAVLGVLALGFVFLRRRRNAAVA